MTTTFLSVRSLCKTYEARRALFGKARPLYAVTDISFELRRGDTFGLVGESGSGKSTIARMLMLAEPPTQGSILLEGKPVSAFDRKERTAYHRRVQPVLQDPHGALNPRMRIGHIIDEPLRIHRMLDADKRRLHVRTLLEKVGLSPDAAFRYPHEFSGGQRQRISIARALALNPDCIILDEPVSALDVSIQAQILNLLRTLQQQLGLAYLLISHDLAVVANMSAVVGVLYLGRFMEIGPRQTLLQGPHHPYTQALVAAVQTRDGSAPPLRGEIPSPMYPPPGCPFQSRCPRAEARCRTERPELLPIGDGHWAACHFATHT
jgi:oligopeptide/dipeptide ABC transporter ATP-binding protein